MGERVRPIHKPRREDIAMNKAILDAIENRLTTNNYDATRGITNDQIRELVHLATRAPSSFNL